jgi:hypothetical protein
MLVLRRGRKGSRTGLNLTSMGFRSIFGGLLPLSAPAGGVAMGRGVRVEGPPKMIRMPIEIRANLSRELLGVR